MLGATLTTHGGGDLGVKLSNLCGVSSRGIIDPDFKRDLRW